MAFDALCVLVVAVGPVPVAVLFGGEAILVVFAGNLEAFVRTVVRLLVFSGRRLVKLKDSGRGSNLKSHWRVKFLSHCGHGNLSYGAVLCSGILGERGALPMEVRRDEEEEEAGLADEGEDWLPGVMFGADVSIEICMGV